MIYDYTAFLLFCLSALLLTTIIILLADVSVAPDWDLEKSTPYECGFQPFDFELQEFDVKYYIVALLFLIFDAEIAFLVPYISASHFFNFVLFSNFLFFFMLLVLGLMYEGKKGYLDGE